MIALDLQDQMKQGAVVKVIGVGGGGSNTVNSIIESGQTNIEFIVVNTDMQALELSKASTKVRIGVKSTKGLGTGANPELGQKAAEEDLDKILEAIVGDNPADIVFLAGGMGGGTGSGALPVIAHALKQKGVLTIAVVTKPFLFEGKRRCRVADQALERLEKEVDILLVIPNQRLLAVTDEKISMIDAFSMINNILAQSVKGIVDIISKAGHINVDFADVRATMKDRGLAIMGTGTASGPNRAQEATLKAISSPLLENMDIQGAQSVLLNISGGKDLGLHEISQAASVIYEKADENAHIIMGSVIDETHTKDIQVTVIATGFNRAAKQEPAITEQPVIVAQPSIQPSCLDRSVKEEVMHTVAPAREALAEPVAPVAQAPELRAGPAQKSTEDDEYALLDTSDLDIPTFMREQSVDKIERS